MNKIEKIKAKLENLKKIEKENFELEQNLLSELREAEKEERDRKCGIKPQFFMVDFGYGGNYYVAATTKEEAIKTLVSEKNLNEDEVRKRIEALGKQVIYRECTCTR